MQSALHLDIKTTQTSQENYQHCFMNIDTKILKKTLAKQNHQHIKKTKQNLSQEWKVGSTYENQCSTSF
jgi:hypothetical protein